MSLDRAKGALLGLACGDAVGATLEFKMPGTFPPLTDMIGGGCYDLIPGQWTDDTSMALCLGESLLRKGGHDPADQLETYVRWWLNGHNSSKDHCFDIGNLTQTMLSNFRRTGEAPNPKVGGISAGNGSLMRLAPVSIRWHNDFDQVIKHAALSSETTHVDSKCVDTCKLLAAITSYLIGGEEVCGDPMFAFSPNFWQYELWGPLHFMVDRIARGSWRSNPPRIKGTGYCIDSLEASIWAVAGAKDFRDAILRAANLGDDADTTAAITGQMAGARWGMGGIPDEWLDKLYRRQDIEDMAANLFNAATT